MATAVGTYGKPPCSRLFSGVAPATAAKTATANAVVEKDTRVVRLGSQKSVDVTQIAHGDLKMQ
jgi:hypothetical protein